MHNFGVREAHEEGGQIEGGLLVDDVKVLLVVRVAEFTANELLSLIFVVVVCGGIFISVSLFFVLSNGGVDCFQFLVCKRGAGKMVKLWSVLVRVVDMPLNLQWLLGTHAMRYKVS